MLPQIICRYTTFLSGITKSSKKITLMLWFRKKWCFPVKLTFETTLIFIWTLRPYFKSYFCRPYNDALPVLVTLSYLAKIFLMFAILTKTVFCLQFLLLQRPPFFYMNGDPLFLFLFSQMICIYITYLSDTKISSTEVTLMFSIVSNFSDFPLHSMQKYIKTVVLLYQPPFVPSADDIVFLLLFF